MRYFILLLILPGIFSCSRKKSPAPIPYDAEFISRINSAEIMGEIAMDKWKDFSLSDLFDSSPEDTSGKKKGIENILSDPSGSGLDILKDIWVFHRNSETGILAGLDNTKDFEKALRENFSEEIIRSGKLSSFINEKFSATWNEEYVLVLITEEKPSASYLFSFFSSERKLFQPVITEENEEKEVLIWSNNAYLKSFLPASLQEIIQPDSFSLTSIDFTDGEAEIKNQGFLSNKKGFLRTFNINPGLFDKKNILNLGFAFNPSALPADHSILNSSFLSQCIDGNLFCRIDTVKSQTQIFKTVELDEEFNTIEKTDTSITYYPSYFISLTIRNSDSCTALLNQLEKQGLLIKDKQGYKATLSSFPVWVYQSENKLCISDDLNNSLDGKDSRLNTGLSAQKSYLHVTLTHQQVLTEVIANDFLPSGLNAFSLSLLPDSNHSIKMTAKLETTEKEAYSLLTLLNSIKSNIENRIKKEGEILFQ